MRRRASAWATGLLLAALACSVVAGLVAWGEGYRAYAVRTGSMSPGMAPGDLLLDAPPSGEYREGQVLTFRSPPPVSAVPLTTHRVVEARGGELVTKGDANPEPDAFTVPEWDVVGEVVARVPKAGYALVFLSRWDGLASLALAMLTVWLSAELFLREEPKPA